MAWRFRADFQLVRVLPPRFGGLRLRSVVVARPPHSIRSEQYNASAVDDLDSTFLSRRGKWTQCLPVDARHREKSYGVIAWDSMKAPGIYT